jgi:hypothetical protein
MLEAGWRREKAEEAVVGGFIYGSWRFGEGTRPDQLCAWAGGQANHGRGAWVALPDQLFGAGTKPRLTNMGGRDQANGR